MRDSSAESAREPVWAIIRRIPLHLSSQSKVDFSRGRFDPKAQKASQSAMKRNESSAPDFQLDETHVKRKVHFRRSALVTHITQLQKRTTQIRKVQAE
jgi:hypothetical protein